MGAPTVRTVFAPQAILDTLVRLDVINRLMLRALLDFRSRVTSEVGDDLGCLIWSGAAGSAPVHARTSDSNHLTSFVWMLLSRRSRLFSLVP